MLVISPYCGFHLLLIKMHLSNSLSLLKVTNNIKFQQFIKLLTLMILMMTLITLMTLFLNDDHNDGRKESEKSKFIDTIMTVTKIYDIILWWKVKGWQKRKHIRNGGNKSRFWTPSWLFLKSWTYGFSFFYVKEDLCLILLSSATFTLSSFSSSMISFTSSSRCSMV